MTRETPGDDPLIGRTLDGARGDAPIGSQAYRESFGAPAPATTRRRWIAPVAVGAVALAIAIAIVTWPRTDKLRVETPIPVPSFVGSGSGSGSAAPAGSGYLDSSPR